MACVLGSPSLTPNLSGTQVACAKRGGGLDLFHKVLCLPPARVPLAIGLPADPGLPPLPGPATATHFVAEVHVVLLFLQACQAIFDVSEFNEDSYWSLRQRLADIRRFAAATACPRDAFAQNWQVAQPLVNVEYYRMASLLGRTFCSHISTMLSDPDGLLVGHVLAILTARATGRSSLCVLGCPGAAKTFALWCSLLCPYAALDHGVLWTSQQHSALLAVVGIATNLLGSRGSKATACKRCASPWWTAAGPFVLGPSKRDAPCPPNESHH